MRADPDALPGVVGVRLDAATLTALTRGRGFERHHPTPNPFGGYVVVASVERGASDYVVTRGIQTTRRATPVEVLAALGEDADADDWESTA